MASSQVVLYDLTSRQGTAWSLNPWKTRMILNYKKIDYRTEWVEYPDLAPKFKDLGVPPNPKDAPGFFKAYTSPVIKYADGTLQMDSWPIAHALEAQYPDPPLHLENPIVDKIRQQLPMIAAPIMAHVIPKVPVVILNKCSADYFNETREKMFGKPLQEVGKGASEEDWEKAKVAAKEMIDDLRQNGGPYFLGQTVSYADFILVSYVQMLKRLDGDVFQKFMALDEAFPKLYEACKQWLEKED